MTHTSSRLHSAASTTIGFLVDWIDGAYQNRVLDGACDAARERRVKLLCFSGGMLQGALRGGVGRNSVFDLAGPENVDGLILMSGTIGNWVGDNGLVRYAERFGALPLVSIAVELPGMASVVVDNRTGIESAITHLIRTHGCQRIAFVRGPKQNPEAELRYQVYQAMLLAHGFQLDTQLVTQGDFLIESGRRAVEELFGRLRLRPDAIVTANDQMAIGVLEALAARGVRVPEEVAVAGFDDIEEARFTFPPLTTVRQPLYEQGREAVRLLLAEVYGGPRGERVTLHTEFIVRRSCRCFTEQSQVSLVAVSKRSSFEAALAERRQIVLADLARAARGGLGMLGAGWEARLLGPLTDDLEGLSKTAFISSVEEALLKLLEQRADFNLLHDVLNALRRHLLACLETDVDRRALAEDLFQHARTLIGQFSERAQAQQKLTTSRWSGALAHAGGALLSSFELADLSGVIAQHFPALGIRSCFLVLYPETGRDGAKLALAYTEGAPDADRRNAPPHRTDSVRRLLDAGVSTAFYVGALFSEEGVLGYVLLDLSNREGIVYEALREFLSAAVRGIALDTRSRKTDAPPPLS